MAEFSKQYCELHNMEFEGDFDIEEIAEELDPGYGIHMTCEGFGFIMISRDDSGIIQLGFADGERFDTPVWIPYFQFIQQQKSSL
jgi:hypothetical protein